MSKKAQQKQASTRRRGTKKPADPDALRQQVQALELREAGLNYRQIASRMGVSHTWAHRLVAQALSEIHSELDERAEHVLRLELDRLDRMLVGLWAKAAGGSPQHVDRVLRIMERRAKLLGLDAVAAASLGIGKDEQGRVVVTVDF